MKSLRVSALGAALCAAVVCSTPQSVVRAQAEGTGVITGRVHVVTHPARRLATAGVYPGRIVGIQTERDASELDNVIVFVDTEMRVDAAPKKVTIRQTNEEFVPHVVAVTAGSTVDFPNDDLVFHNVFSLSRVATFDLGRYPRSTSKARSFAKPGIVKVFCHLHSHMSAIVRVFPHPYFVIPDRDGRFTIPSVPAGRYAVTAWHERAGEVTHSAMLETDGASEVSFSLPLTDSE
jgi:plastocyanin